MDVYIRQVQEAAAFVKERLDLSPGIGLLTGTGLGQSADSLQITAAMQYREIPHFPVSTVAGHPGRLLAGKLGGRELMVMQGRVHLYEGYSPRQVTFPIRVMQEMGVDTLILTNAAGGLRTGLKAGDIMLIEDHINLTGENPLIGPNVDRWGIRFPDMTRAYDPGLADLCRKGAAGLGLALQQGVYGGLKGPSLETPAEIRMLKTIGVDAVGFSTIMETIVGVHAGMRVTGLSTITNINDPDRPEPATLEAIVAVARSAAPRIESIIASVVENIDAARSS